MSKGTSAMNQALAAEAIRTAARIYRDASLAERVEAKLRLVTEFDPTTDAVVYPMRWMLSTGRASAAMLASLDAMKPSAFAKTLAALASEVGTSGVRAIADAWVERLRRPRQP